MNKKTLLNKINNYTGLTHPATFHADDVLSTCLLRIINPGFKVTRSNVVPTDFEGIIYDIGLGEYDHHQYDAKIRKSGIKYAAFGLLWNDLGNLFMDNEHSDIFDAVFISEIDRCDNSPDTNLLSSSIELFNPTWNSDEISDEKFEEAVTLFTPILKALIYHFKKSTFIPRYCYDIEECLNTAFERTYKKLTNQKIEIPLFADIKDVWSKYSFMVIPNEEPIFFERTFLNQIKKTYGKYKTSPFILALTSISKEERINFLSAIMERRFFNINSLCPAREKCEEIYQASNRKDVIVLDKYIPYDSLADRHESVKAVIFPSERNGYNILCLNMTQQEKEKNGLNMKKAYKRMEFLPELRGKTEDYLRSYADGLFFVHPSGHMASCDTLEEAINFFEKTRKNR